METRTSGIRADEIIRRTLFTKVEKVEVQGFSGGIWMFWREDLVEVDLLATNPQTITV